MYINNYLGDFKCILAITVHLENSQLIGMDEGLQTVKAGLRKNQSLI